MTKITQLNLMKTSFLAQRGIALITALLVVALATIIAVTMMMRQQLDLRRTENLIHSEQAYQYALGGEHWASLILLRDRQQNVVDHLQELWATTLPSLPIEGGYLQAQLEDLQSRFNLNNLLTKEGKMSAPDVAYFERLLSLLELPRNLGSAVVDWIDHDVEPQISEGAEDLAYLTKTPAYRTANQFFKSPSELRLVKGFDQENYNKLAPYITALPSRTLINVNTAPALILMALVSEEVSESDISSLLATRSEVFFKTTMDFSTHPALAGLKVKTELLSVNSDFFQLTLKSQVGRGHAQISSLLYRSSDQVKVISRHQGLQF